jgi:hypothetical protein
MEAAGTTEFTSRGELLRNRCMAVGSLMQTGARIRGVDRSEWCVNMSRESIFSGRQKT